MSKEKTRCRVEVKVRNQYFGGKTYTSSVKDREEALTRANGLREMFNNFGRKVSARYVEDLF